MEQPKKNEIKIEMTPEVASGNYSNLAVLAHNANEFYLDFILMSPNGPAKVQTRVIMAPENARNLFFALRDNLQKYEHMFGEIQRKVPNQSSGNNNNGGENPNSFMA